MGVEILDDVLRNTEVKWGELGYVTFKRTYARRIKEDDPNSKTEEFWQVVKRELDASERQLGVGFTEEEKIRYAKSRLQLKWSVAGRFLWQLNTKTVDKLGLPSLQNCAFTIVNEPIRPFTWTFEMLMLGSGVGYNIQKHHVYQLPKVKNKIKIVRKDTNDADFIVPDSREGWVKLLGKVLKAHFYSGEGFTYSTVCIRGKGAPIRGFGGTASGPEDLCWGIAEISKIINARSKKKLRPVDCLDIMNIIGFVVVAGNVRRSAQLAIGDYDDIEFIKAKRWDLESIPNWRAMSNNSVAAPDDLDDLPGEFWQTYEQGEPYGLINLDLSRRVGRTGESQYPDADVEGFNPCVSGDTEILTSGGYIKIKDIIDKDVMVWNGFEWSKVVPKITGYNQPMLRVKLSDGRSLDCTTYHKWYKQVSYVKGDQRCVLAKDLKIGDKLIKYDFPVLNDGECVESNRAYTQGFISADGMDNTNNIWLYEPKFCVENRLSGRVGDSVFILETGVKRKMFFHNIKSYSKKFVPFKWNLEGRLNWLAGLMDGDGCALKEGGAQITSINESFLLDVQKMLSTMGVNSKVVLASKEGLRCLPDGDGHGGSKEYFCQTGYRICIGAKQIQYLLRLGLKCERLVFDKEPNRDASQYVRVTSIEELPNAKEVYCFNEPLRHFGIFNGILTGQCAEQSLTDKETCCLSEIYLPNINSFEEFIECLTYAYRMCKHSLALHCSLKETEKIVNANMRMGIGITGILQATVEQRSWLESGYTWLRKFDKKYSKENGFPESIKLTTVKPSGTLSLLAGVTHGVHPNPAGHYYIRRIRIASDSPLIDVCRSHGYFIEPQKNFDGSIDKNTMVVEFPCSVPESTPVASDYSWKEQLDMVRRMQREWSDNSVSCTVYYRKEDLPEIKEYLKEHFKDEMKTVSFLLYNDHGFTQAPYETITKEKYLELKAKVIPITSVEVKETDFDLADCEGGACPIK